MTRGSGRKEMQGPRSLPSPLLLEYFFNLFHGVRLSGALVFEKSLMIFGHPNPVNGSEVKLAGSAIIDASLLASCSKPVSALSENSSLRAEE